MKEEEAQGRCLGRGRTLCSWFQTILQYMSEIALTCVQPVEISIHHLYDLSVTHVLSSGTLRLSFSVFSVLLFFVLFFLSSSFFSVSPAYSSVSASVSYYPFR